MTKTKPLFTSTVSATNGVVSNGGTMSVNSAPPLGGATGDSGPWRQDSGTTVNTQRRLPFDQLYSKARETRAERCQRLLEGLRQPASKINTAVRFDYDKAR
mgnify:FL=1